MNAPISLGKPPRSGVEQLVVNLHWSTVNVNLIVDGLNQSVVVSKDAKAIISADISPVQRPGRSRKRKLELPDHSWDQPRINAVTPMTFLFLNTIVKPRPFSTVESLHISTSDSITPYLTSGQGVTLLSLSFYEPETTLKCLNEILY